MLILGGYLPHTSDPPTLNVEYLVAAGGGAGGGGSGSASGKGGGGGAGGLLIGTASLASTSPIAITVGPGGSGSSKTSGGNSSIGSLVVAFGGGRGAHVPGSAAESGGSGGGGSNQSDSFTGPGSGVPGQGFDGSRGSRFDAGNRAGSGGGAGGPAPDAIGGPPGPGVTSSITGTATIYCTGGRGNGESMGSVVASAFGGGGNGQGPGADGSDGQPGIVVIRYEGTSARASGGTISYITVGSTSYVVHTFTSSGALSF